MLIEFLKTLFYYWGCKEFACMYVSPVIDPMNDLSTWASLDLLRPSNIAQYIVLYANIITSVSMFFRQKIVLSEREFLKQ